MKCHGILGGKQRYLVTATVRPTTVIGIQMIGSSSNEIGSSCTEIGSSFGTIGSSCTETCSSCTEIYSSCTEIFNSCSMISCGDIDITSRFSKIDSPDVKMTELALQLQKLHYLLHFWQQHCHLDWRFGEFGTTCGTRGRNSSEISGIGWALGSSCFEFWSTVCETGNGWQELCSTVSDIGSS